MSRLILLIGDIPHGDCPHGEGLLAIDLDSDGKNDLVTGNKWYKNNGTMDGPGWKEYTLSTSWQHGNVFIGSGDINLDGRIDLVLSPSERVYHSYHISWLEHPVNSTDEWREHVLKDNVQCVYHFIGCGDFDLDGNTDIVTAEMHHGTDPDEVIIYANKGKGTSWTKQVLWEGGSHSCRIFDCDHDGDLDFFGANYLGTEVNLWVNETHPKPLSLDKWSYIQIDSLRDQRNMGAGHGRYERGRNKRYCFREMGVFQSGRRYGQELGTENITNRRGSATGRQCGQ
ncbi:MAG: FG-GAP repeat domain-containing protein [Mangrovibacterium sp.]